MTARKCQNMPPLAGIRQIDKLCTLELSRALQVNRQAGGQSIIVAFTPRDTVRFKLYYPGQLESLVSRFGRWLHL